MQQHVQGVNIPEMDVSTNALDTMRNLTDNSELRADQNNMNVMKLRVLQMDQK